MSETYLFFDTETTSVPDWPAPSDRPHQPHIVQLTALLTDEKGQKLSSLDLLIRHKGWESGPEAFAKHGITAERANRGGIDEADAIVVFWALATQATGLICHGVPFDKRLLRIAMKRYRWDENFLEALKTKPAFCTMKHATKICDLPPTDKMKRAGHNKPKQASLGEAYRHFTGKTLEGAHNAMVDVLACKTVFFAILDHYGVTEPDWDKPGRSAAAPKKAKATPEQIAAAKAAKKPAPAPLLDEAPKKPVRELETEGKPEFDDGLGRLGETEDVI